MLVVIFALTIWISQTLSHWNFNRAFITFMLMLYFKANLILTLLTSRRLNWSTRWLLSSIVVLSIPWFRLYFYRSYLAGLPQIIRRLKRYILILALSLLVPTIGLVILLRFAVRVGATVLITLFIGLSITALWMFVKYLIKLTKDLISFNRLGQRQRYSREEITAFFNGFLTSHFRLKLFVLSKTVG